jgi:hypothetical protein
MMQLRSSGETGSASHLGRGRTGVPALGQGEQNGIE